METIPNDSVDAPRQIITRVIMMYTGLAILSITFSFLSGVFRVSSLQPPVFIVGWLEATVMAILIDYSRRLGETSTNRLTHRIWILVPAVIRVSQDLLQLINYRYEFTYVSVRETYLLLAESRLLIIFCVAFWLTSAYRRKVHNKQTNSTPTTDLGTLDTTIPSQVKKGIVPLGVGEETIGRVIISVVRRSLRSEQIATFSLRVMIVLVIVGGMASFGLWMFTHADRISSLESERIKLLALQSEIKDTRDKLGAAATDDIKAQLDRVNKFIDQNYSGSESFKDTLNRLSLQSQTNYADIAIRVTIAVLTIFLVQVFFSVYKYNRHLAIILAAKAEALELVGSDDGARKELSKEAIGIVKESIPGFGAQPKTPLEQLVSAFEKVRK
jgi:hypothetical protein